MNKNEIYRQIYIAMSDKYYDKTGDLYPYDLQSFIFYLNADRDNVNALELLNDSYWSFTEKSYLGFLDRLPELQLKKTSLNFNKLESKEALIISLYRSNEYNRNNKKNLFFPCVEENKILRENLNLKKALPDSKVLDNLYCSQFLHKVWKKIPLSNKYRQYVKVKVINILSK